MEKVIYRDDIVEYKNFLSDEECEQLVAYYISGEDGWQKTCFYNSAVMDPIYPYNKNNASIINDDYFKSLRTRLHEKAEEVAGRNLRNLSMSAHKWEIGAYASDHSDNTDLDGTPNAWQDNKFVTIIYLNDEYSGGKLTFKNHNIEIQPGKGSLIAFDPGYDNLHAVTEILSGTRYTMLLSWDHDNIKYSQQEIDAMARQKAEEKYLQDKQKEEWEAGNKYA